MLAVFTQKHIREPLRETPGKAMSAKASEKERRLEKPLMRI